MVEGGATRGTQRAEHQATESSHSPQSAKRRRSRSEDATTRRWKEKDICNNCGGRVRRLSGERVCRQCGLVHTPQTLDQGAEWRGSGDGQGESTLQRCDGHSEEGAVLQAKQCRRTIGTWYERNTSDSATGQDIERLSRIDNRSARTTERVLAEHGSSIHRIVSSLGYSKQLTRRAGTILRTSQRAGLFDGRKIESFLGAAVYVACRERDKPVRPGEVAVRTALTEGRLIGRQTPRQVVMRAFRKILACDDVTVYVDVQQSPAVFIGRYADAVGLTGEARSTANTWATAIHNSASASGQSASSLAVGCLYHSAQVHDIDLSQRQLADATDVSVDSLRSGRDKLVRFLKQTDRDL